ncbi:hypothetical protein BY458DRAFT_504690 [Sporodiniella umbellata]|nr:hypothetical protein BY458DRAFT_504690 [Sporodiniella umbellata]
MNSKLRMVALYDCIADDAEELSFKEGDIFIHVIPASDKDWYEGTIEHSDRRGLFPGNFVKSLSAEGQKPPVKWTGLSVGDMARGLTTEKESRLQRKPSLPSSPPVLPKPLGNVHSPTRVRSYSASFIKSSTPRPSQLKHPWLEAPSRVETEEEEDDGFQLVKPSEILRRQHNDAREHPMPLRPLTSRKTARPPPLLKPKPQPVLPPRPTKLRSASNPPPLQPKPTFVDPPKKKKVAPPPPPSRRPEPDRARYERLFFTVHDEGYIDALTVQSIWNRSRLDQEALARIWKESEPNSQGLLDKQGFIHGMGKIDLLLKKHQSSA